MNKLVLISLMYISLYADFTLVYKMDDKINEIIKYKDAKNVMLSYTIDGEEDNLSQTGQYFIDGKRYTVTNEDGQLTYIDMDQADIEASKLTEDLNISQEECQTDEKPFFTILKRGDAKTIKGIKGEEWEVESQEDGEMYKESIIVTKNKELVDAMTRSFEILKLFGEGPYGMEIGSDTESMMLVSEGYVLLSAEGIEFEKLDHHTVSETIFQLPKDAIDGMKNLPTISDEEKEIEKKILKDMLDTNQVCIVKQGE